MKGAEKTPMKEFSYGHKTPMKEFGTEVDQNSPLTNAFSPVPAFRSRAKPAARRRNWEDKVDNDASSSDTSMASSSSSTVSTPSTPCSCNSTRSSRSPVVQAWPVNLGAQTPQTGEKRRVTIVEPVVYNCASDIEEVFGDEDEEEFGEPLELADEIAYMLTSCLDIVVGNCLGGSVTYHPSTNSDQNDHENSSTTGERRSLMRD